MKTEEINSVVQRFYPYIPPTFQTTLAFQDPPCVPNPPRLMASRFAPLALPAVLHDLPQIMPKKFPSMMGMEISQQDNMLINLMICWT